MPARPKIRQAKIAEFVARRGQASVEELAEMFSASLETIRRDLSVLADSGEILKIHGGAKRKKREDEGPFEERMARNRVGKKVVAEKLARWMSAGQTVFIDTGSTTLIAAEALARVGGLTAITNSARIASALANGAGGAKVHLLGGLFDPDNGETVGPDTVEAIGRFRADCAVITVAAFSELGAFDYNFDEASVARAMIANARKTVVVADATKLDKNAPFAVCALRDVDVLVLDEPPEPDLAAALFEAEVRVL